tara:strand:+ start:1091 stop:3472 length:2382 start_codon:yes stop_codon:yes gene_type:complete
MKNKYLILLFYTFLFVKNTIHANEITFDSDVIDVLDNGNTIVASQGIARSADSNIQIEADLFNYNKNLSILVATGNVVVKEISNNILLKSDKINYNKNLSILVATGNVVVKELSNNTLLRSNEIFYNIKNKKIESKVSSEVEDELGNLFLSKNFIFTLNDSLIKFNNLKLIDIQNNISKVNKAFVNLTTKKLIGKDILIDFSDQYFQNDSEPRLKGNTIKSNLNKTTITKGVFTTCKKNDDCPPWQLSALEIKHDKKKKIIYYEKAWLKIYDKPVFYFPKFFHPDPTVKRQSGFLMPSFASSKNLGTTFMLPYYHVVSDNKDFTITPRVYADDRLSFQSEYRQVNSNSKHTLDFSATGEKNKSMKNHFFLRSSKRFDFLNFDESEVNIQLEQVTSDTYLKSYKLKSPIIKDYDTLSSAIKIRANKEDLILDLDFSVYEDLAKKDSDRFEYVFPNYNLFKSFKSNEKLNGAFSFNSGGYIKNYDTNISEKVVINDLYFNSDYKITEAGLRNGYNLLIKNVNSDSNNSLNYKNTFDQKMFSIAEYNSTYPLKKSTANYDNIFKPMVSLRYSPNTVKDLSDDETRIDTDNIFSLNRLSKNDIVESGASMTYGAEFTKTNMESLDIIDVKIANIIRAKEEEKLPHGSTLGKKTSDIFGSLNYNPNKYISTGYDFALKNNLSENNYEILKSQLKINNIVTSFEYLNVNNTSGKESFLSNKTAYTINKSTNLSFETRKNKKTKLTEFYNLIYQYRNDCLIAAIEYNKDYYSDRDLKPEETIFIKLTIIPFGETRSPSLK